MGNENAIKSHFIFHEPLIFNRSRKTHGFFYRAWIKKPPWKPLTPWKIAFQFMAFSLSLKSHEKNMVGFILFHGIFMGFLFVTVFSWAMKRWILRGFSCFFHEIFMPYSWYFFVKNPWKFPIKISWKTYEKRVNLPWTTSLDFHGF